jgi:AcrR family transcriptional regulator
LESREDEPMAEARATKGRWSRDAWIELGVARLAAEGPGALTLEALCAQAGRTRGSFYHHFPTVEALLVDIARRWRRTETDEIGQVGLENPDPRAGLRALARRSERMDHRLEIGIRLLGGQNPDVAALVREADAAREAILTDLLARAYGLTPRAAGDTARLFHSLQLAAQMRTPDDVGGFSMGPARRLTAWLDAEAGR